MAPTTGQPCFLAVPALTSSLFQLLPEQEATPAPAPCQLLVLDNRAFHKAPSLRRPPLSASSSSRPLPQR